MARFSPGPVRRYRWKELGLFIIPFMILVLEMIQLPIAQYYQSKIQTNRLSIPLSCKERVPTPLRKIPGVRNALCLLLRRETTGHHHFPKYR